MIRHVASAVSTFAAIVTLATGAGAQSQIDKLKSSTPAERATMQTEMMASKLSLTPDQRGKISAINLKYAQQMQPIIQSQEGPLMRLRQMRQVSEAKEAEIKQVLSPDQFQTYLAEKEQMREQFEEKLVK